MTITSHFTIPDNLPDWTGQQLHDLVLDIRDWAAPREADCADVAAKVDPRFGPTPYVLITRPGNGSYPLQAMPGDTLVITDRKRGADHHDGEVFELRFATVEEEAQLFQAERSAQPTLESTEYELTWQNLNGTVGRAAITADQISADDQYLMFMLGGKIVHATRHSQVIEFNQPEVHYDNVRDGDGEQVRLNQSGTENKFLP